MRLPWDDWQLEPTVAFAALGLSAPATSEQNAVGIGQRIYGQSLTSLRSAVTLPVSHSLSVAGDRPLTLRGLLGWTHEFADVTAATQAAFVAAPGAAFTATTAPIARDSLLFGLAADFGIANGVALFAGWQAALGGTSTVQTVRAGLRLTW
jgi:outer membrane autotransporter protein